MHQHTHHLVGHVKHGRVYYVCTWPGCDWRGNPTEPATEPRELERVVGEARGEAATHARSHGG